jgi:hypothetical protein
MTDNALARYWKREKKLESVSFIDICEQYEYSGQATVAAAANGSMLESTSFSKHSYRKVMVLSGQEIPDIASSLDQTQIDYYYLAILTLFKPHRGSDLVGEGQSPLRTYMLFLQSVNEKCTAFTAVRVAVAGLLPLSAKLRPRRGIT